MNGDGMVALAVSGQDPSRGVVIDPVVDFAAVVGGSGADAGLDVAVDGNGNTYLTGWTVSADMPAAVGALSGPSDEDVTKIAPSGAVLYTTYLGGTGNDYGLGWRPTPSATCA